jgi:hypothetical protein
VAVWAGREDLSKAAGLESSSCRSRAGSDRSDFSKEAG